MSDTEPSRSLCGDPPQTPHQRDPKLRIQVKDWLCHSDHEQTSYPVPPLSFLWHCFSEDCKTKSIGVGSILSFLVPSMKTKSHPGEWLSHETTLWAYIHLKTCTHWQNLADSGIFFCIMELKAQLRITGRVSSGHIIELKTEKHRWWLFRRSSQTPLHKESRFSNFCLLWIFILISQNSISGIHYVLLHGLGGTYTSRQGCLVGLAPRTDELVRESVLTVYCGYSPAR